MEDFQAIVIGGGVIGLACAAELTKCTPSVLLLEAAERFGMMTSSRNSGVIHAGLYYPAGSLKARLCVRGRELIYQRCAADGIGYSRCGKLVVATNTAEVLRLQSLQQRAVENGATEVRWVGSAALRRLEPHVQGVAALWSPMSGILDAHGLMDSYRRQALAGGATLVTRCQVVGLQQSCGAGWSVWVREPERGSDQQLSSRCVINAAGLWADRVAGLAGLDCEALGYRQHLCKGDYFRLGPRVRGLVRHLVYPLPVEAGLGIHVTPDLGGELNAGPDAEYVSWPPAYTIESAKRAHFAAALRRYLPAVHDSDLEPNYSGIRPKLQAPGQPFRDFVIEEATPHGAPGLVNLLGIESPGLTASAAIAQEVTGLVKPWLDARPMT